MAESDLTEFFTYGGGDQKPCLIPQFELGDKDRKLLAAACVEPKLSNAQIMAWLRVRSVDVSNSALISHRKGTCSCGRSK